jgi:hypothetical protein
MKEATGTDLMVSKLEEMQATCTASLLGGVASIEEYRRIVGVVQGVKYAVEVIRDVEKRLTEGGNE